MENLAYDPRVPVEVDILNYWKTRYANDNDLANLFQVVLAIPTSQVSVGRAFEALAEIFTKLRTRLS